MWRIPPPFAYGNWQLSQAYQATGDLQKALDYGDKALAGSPHNLDIWCRSKHCATSEKTTQSSWTTLRSAARCARR